MSLGIYLNPLNEPLSVSKNWKRNTVGETITHYNDEVKLFEYDIAIIGVMEQRGNVGNDGAKKNIFRLYKPNHLLCMVGLLGLVL